MGKRKREGDGKEEDRRNPVMIMKVESSVASFSSSSLSLARLVIHFYSITFILTGENGGMEEFAEKSIINEGTGGALVSSVNRQPRWLWRPCCDVIIRDSGVVAPPSCQSL